MPRLSILILFVVALFAATPAIAAERLALVIGNAGYQNVLALDNPVNDARLMARTLGDAGFRVSLLVEADRAQMVRAIEQFRRKVEAAGPGSLALFYFAGHGVRSDGFNYLVPLGVQIRAEPDIARETVAAEWVVEQIDVPGVTSVMVLDACRDNPFDGQGPGKIPALGDGLARMTATNSNLIAYATGPGDAAFDGAGENSPYTAALVRAIRTPGLDVEQIFGRVRDEVVTETAGLQVPWESSSLDSAVYLRPDAALRAAAAPAATANAAEGAPLHLSVTFNAHRTGWDGTSGCNTIYSYDPVRLPGAAGPARRVRTAIGAREVALELSVIGSGAGIELVIRPVSGGQAGRQITVALDRIRADRELALYTRARHPDLSDCGTMEVFLRRGS